MPCEVTSGVTRDCENRIAGIQKIYIANRSDVDVYNVDEISGVTTLTLKSGKVWYTFDFNDDTASLNQPLQTGGNNNYFFNQELSFSSDALGLATLISFENLINSDVIAVVETANGERLLAGIENGFRRTTEYTNASGAAAEDEFGHSIVKVARSRTLARPLVSTITLATT